MKDLNSKICFAYRTATIYQYPGHWIKSRFLKLQFFFWDNLEPYWKQGFCLFVCLFFLSLSFYSLYKEILELWTHSQISPSFAQNLQAILLGRILFASGRCWCFFVITPLVVHKLIALWCVKTEWLLGLGKLDGVRNRGSREQLLCKFTCMGNSTIMDASISLDGSFKSVCNCKCKRSNTTQGTMCNIVCDWIRPCLWLNQTGWHYAQPCLCLNQTGMLVLLKWRLSMANLANWIVFCSFELTDHCSNTRMNKCT